jgi:hypothetical protein
VKYPDPELRPFVDLDLLVVDPERAHRALLDAGFEEMAEPPWAASRSSQADVFANKHHTRPLSLPGIPLKVELHRWPSWPRWLTPPAPDGLLAAAVPSELGVDGVLTLPPAEHTLVLAAHSWVNEPLGRVRDLLDVTLMSGEAEREELSGLAGRWGMGRLWRATLHAAESSLLRTRRSTVAQRTWARNVPAMRERTVIEAHLENWISCYWTSPPLGATRLALSNLAWDLLPADESWRTKLSRAAGALGHARSPKSVHDEALGADAQRLSPSTRWRGRPGPSAETRDTIPPDTGQKG